MKDVWRLQGSKARRALRGGGPITGLTVLGSIPNLFLIQAEPSQPDLVLQGRTAGGYSAVVLRLCCGLGGGRHEWTTTNYCASRSP